jgi:serine/threonine protein kinase
MTKQENISDEAKDLVCSMVKIDPRQRLSADQILEHKWFAKKFGSQDCSKLGSA